MPKSRNENEEDSENFENIEPEEIPQQQRPMQVGSNVERSYSADELAEPMQAYPRTSERANEGQELTVRKRLMLTETEESTANETQTGQPNQTSDTLILSQTAHETQVTTADVSVSHSPLNTASPSTAVVENRLGEDGGDNQDYGTKTPVGSRNMVATSDASSRLDEAAGSANVSGVKRELDVDASKSSFIDITKDEQGGQLVSQTPNALGSVEPSGPSDASGQTSSQYDQVAQSAESKSQDAVHSQIPINIDRGPSRDGTNGPSAAQPGLDDFSGGRSLVTSGTAEVSAQPGLDDVSGGRSLVTSGTAEVSAQPGIHDVSGGRSMFTSGTAKVAARSGLDDVSGGRSLVTSGATEAAIPPTEDPKTPTPQPEPQFSGLKPLHPIENSRQKWELTGGMEECDIELEEEKANQVAIAPMRLSMTNESEVELDSIEIDPKTGNNDVKMGIRKSEAPLIEVEDERPFADKNDVDVGNAESPQRYPSSAAAEETGVSRSRSAQVTPGGALLADKTGERTGDRSLTGDQSDSQGVVRSKMTADVGVGPSPDDLLGEDDREGAKSGVTLGEDTVISSFHEEPEDQDNLAGGTSNARTRNIDKDDGDGGSVDTNDSGARPEYAFNIEDSRPPWILEAHTQLASSKNSKTPRIVKSYDEEVEVGEAMPVRVDKEREHKDALEAHPEEASREGMSRSADIPRYDSAAASRTGETPVDESGGEPKLFQRNLRELSEHMHSVDNEKQPSIAETFSAETFEEKEEVEEENMNVRDMTPGPNVTETEQTTKDLQQEHSLTQSDAGSQPEQHTNRRMLAKPLETGSPTCEFVNSDMQSQYSKSSVGSQSKSYSYAKSKSRSSIEISFANDERAASPQERGVDAGIQVPSAMESQMDVVSNESAAANSVTVPAEKEGDIDFYPSKSSADPSVYNRSIDEVKPEYEMNQPTQRQSHLQCIDDDESSEEPTAIVQLDDARDNLWTIQPKEHKRKSKGVAEKQEEEQENDDEFEPEDSYEQQPPDPKGHRPSDIDSGVGSRRPTKRGGGGNRRNPSFQSSQSSFLPRGRNQESSEYGNYMDNLEDAEALNSYDESPEYQDYEIQSSKSSAEAGRVNLRRFSDDSFQPIVHPEQSVSFESGANSSDDILSGNKRSSGSTMTPIIEERTTSQNQAEVSEGYSFHSCDENMENYPTQQVRQRAADQQNDFNKNEDQSIPVQKHDAHTESNCSSGETRETHAAKAEFGAQRSSYDYNYEVNPEATQYHDPVSGSQYFSQEVSMNEQSAENPGELTVREEQELPKRIEETENIQLYGEHSQTMPQNASQVVSYNEQNEIAAPRHKGKTGNSMQQLPGDNSVELQLQATSPGMSTKEKTCSIHQTSSAEAETENISGVPDIAGQERSAQKFIQPQSHSGVFDSSHAEELEEQFSGVVTDASVRSPAVAQFGLDATIVDEAAVSAEFFDASETILQPDTRRASIEISSGEKMERFMVDVPKSSPNEKSIITRQRVKETEMNGFTEAMETPRLGPSATPSVQLHSPSNSAISKELSNARRNDINIVDSNNKNNTSNNPADKSFATGESTNLHEQILNSEAFAANVSENLSQHVSMETVRDGSTARQEYSGTHQGPIGANERPQILGVQAGQTEPTSDTSAQSMDPISNVDSAQIREVWAIYENIDSPHQQQRYNQQTMSGDSESRAQLMQIQEPRPHIELTVGYSENSNIAAHHVASNVAMRQQQLQHAMQGRQLEANSPHHHSSNRAIASHSEARNVKPHVNVVYPENHETNYSVQVFEDKKEAKALHKRQSLQSLNDINGNFDGQGMHNAESMYKLMTRKSMQSLSDGLSYASQSVRGSQFAIDMRPESTPSLNLPLNFERSLVNEAELASVPVTPRTAATRAQHVGGVAMRSSSFKLHPGAPGSSRGAHSVNGKYINGSTVNTPKTMDIELPSPRDESQHRAVMSSQSMERQIRITRVRASGRAPGDESKHGSRSRGGSRARKSRSPSKNRKGGSKAASMDQATTVAAGDEKPVVSAETLSNDNEIVAQVGFGYVTQKDLPMMGKI